MPIVINLSPEVEAQLQEKAARVGQDVNLVAAEILTEVLANEAQELQESIKGIQRGLDDFEAGRYRSFREFAEEKRRKIVEDREVSTVRILHVRHATQQTLGSDREASER